MPLPGLLRYTPCFPVTVALTTPPPAVAVADQGSLAAGSASLAVQSKAAGKAAKKTAIKPKGVKVSDLKWTGKKLSAKVKVTSGKKTLKKGRDYMLSIKNTKGKKVSKPKDVGTYKAVFFIAACPASPALQR